MSALSDQLVTFAILAYLVAMISHAVEYALGNGRATRPRTVAAPARELATVGAGSGAGTGPSDVGPAVATGAAGDVRRDPGRLAGLIGVGLTALAALLHLGALVTRGVAADRMPWGNMYEYVLTVSFIGVAAWLAVLAKRPALRHLGLFLTLVMVLLLAFAEMVLYVEITPLIPALNSYWFVIHVSTVVFSSGIFLLGFVPAVMYLMRNGYESGRRGFPYDLARRVPKAATLERLTFGLHAFAFPVFTFAVIAGAIWAEAAWGRPWGWDPKETWSFISWVIYAGYLHARATPSVKRNVAVWIAVLGFATMLMNLFGVNIFFEGLHSYGGLD
ncbi:c-type cytochrome biogenesis protein CcsB [Micromonospora echinofusca]|uniref:C-type cytochrome biogenesis protein CcsB n=1 Tax=Micromonospora echinofusca TaxID=47858 RepID=A0ABS3VSR5_MICEH|nr:c-type cytochrome biogenesis protein CcsB [Micromonospora echinofusca]MBO4207586.1 c-type cytochrome biogenesis protein CcsB [Micromonospora echinofusca]